MIRYLDVHKSFGRPVLSGVTLEVRDGETLGIVGPSGTGKSVLLKTTIGLVEPDAGDVQVAGTSLVGASARELERVRRQVGYVFQNAALFDSLTVFENVALGLPEQTASGLSPEQAEWRVAGALEEVNLGLEVLFQHPAELSGGMRKRVGIARAIIGQPRVLLWDEPVTGLDPVNSAAVDRLIRAIADRHGVTSVVVTHDVEGALRLCDRLALLEGGAVRFLGTPAEFRSSDNPLVRAFVDRDAAAAPHQS